MSHEKRARRAFRHVLEARIADPRTRRIVEIGPADRPIFLPEELPAHIERYTVIDVEAKYLEQLPQDYQKIVWDMSKPITVDGEYDLVFSAFCAEHVPSGLIFHANCRKMLRPGGYSIHLIPTLYSSPFVINYLLPDFLTRRLLDFGRVLSGHRPRRRKYPAYYSLCTADQGSFDGCLGLLGFHVSVEPFWGHDYYKGLPLIGRVEQALCRWCERRGWTAYASYAIINAKVTALHPVER